MQVQRNGDEIVVTMTTDELVTLRYALAIGVEKLQSTASYMKAMKSLATKSVERTANEAVLVCESLEQATRAMVRS